MPNTCTEDQDWSYPKGEYYSRQLQPWMATLSIGEPTNTPSVNIKTLDLLNFGIIRGISKDYCCIESYPELSSDHSSVIFTVNSKIITKEKPCILCNGKTKWPYFQELLKDLTWQLHPTKNWQWHYLRNFFL